MALAYVGPVATAFAYWAVVEAGRHFPASKLSVVLLATPSLGLLISAITLHEPINAGLIVGMILVGAGIRLVTASGQWFEPFGVSSASARAEWNLAGRSCLCFSCQSVLLPSMNTYVTDHALASRLEHAEAKANVASIEARAAAEPHVGANGSKWTEPSRCSTVRDRR